MEQNSCTKYKELMMGLIDGELSEEEIFEINSHLIKCSSCREEYEQLKKTSSKLDKIHLEEPRDEILDKIWKSPYSKFSKNIGLFMIFAGWITLILYSIYEFFILRENDPIPKVATIIIFTGFIILLITVIRDRIKAYRSDPYKEVER